MKPIILAGVAALLLAGPAAAQTSTTTTTTTTETTGSISFSPEQETIIRRSITSAEPVELKERVTVGATLPADVQLQSFSQEIYTDVPSVRSYRYVTTDAGVVLVDPSTRRVVRVITSR